MVFVFGLFAGVFYVSLQVVLTQASGKRIRMLDNSGADLLENLCGCLF